jgi:polyferredoxin
MTKVGRPTGLIAYDNEINIHRREEGKDNVYRLVRPRTIIYAAIIAIVGGIMLYALATRSFLDINVLHDRNPLAVTLSDGSVRNAYTVRLLNKRNTQRSVTLDVTGVDNATLHVVGSDSVVEGRPLIAVGPDQTAELRVLVTAPAGAKLAKSTSVTFRIADAAESATARDHFILP